MVYKSLIWGLIQINEKIECLPDLGIAVEILVDYKIVSLTHILVGDNKCSRPKYI